MKVYHLLRALVVAACLLLLLGEYSAAGSLVRRDDDDDVEDRELEIEMDGDQVEVEGLAPNGQDRVEFEMELKDDDGHLFDSEFSWKTGDNETELEVKLKFRLMSVVEYNESGTTPGFQGDEDTVISTYGGDADFDEVPNTQASWDDFQALPDDVTDNGATVKSFEATTEDGVLTIRGKISTQPTTANGGVLLNPNSMKVDIEVSNYPSKEDESFIALICRLTAENEIGDDDDDNEEGEEDDDDEVVFSGTEALPVAAFFGWEPTLTVDDTTVNVIASDLLNQGTNEEGIEYEIVFSFPAAGDVYSWDPTTGISYVAQDSGAASSMRPFCNFGFFSC